MVNLHAQDEATERLNVASIRPGESIPMLVGPAGQREGPCLSLPTHVLMATGGDIRLRTDPETLLNGYGYG